VDKRRLGIIFAIVLVDMLSFSIVLPLLPYLADDLGASAAMIGLLTAVYPFAQFFGAPLLGRLSDRFGRKPVLLASIAGTAFGFVVLAVARVLPILFVSRFIDGITGGNISVAQAYIADVTDEESRGKALGMIGAAFGLGFILGPVSGGLLSDISYAAPAWAGAILAVINMGLVKFFLPESLTDENKARLAKKRHSSIDFNALRATFAHPRVGRLLWMRLSTGMAYGIFETGFVLWAIAALSLSARTNGLLLGYIGILSVLVQAFLIGKLTARFSDEKLILGSISLAGIALAIWGFVPNIPLLLLLMPALSVGLAVSNTIMTSALSKSVDRDEVGGIMGLQMSIQSFTRIPTPIIAGLLIERAPVWSPGLTAAAFSSLAIPIAWSLARNAKEKAAPATIS